MGTFSGLDHAAPAAYLLRVLTKPPPPDELEDAIRALKREKNAILLAHYYQESEIQDLADFIGDSLQLAQEAKKTDADVICFAGVHFMAETAKIVNPDKIVVVPDLDAGCSLADGCPAPEFERWLAKYPDHKVVSYINCSAAVKALSDVICTSSSAVKIVASFPRDQRLVFAPDKHLGRWVMKETGRDDLVLWPGTCIVHETFSERRLIALKIAHPGAEVIAHPECEDTILRHAAFIGSTSALLDHVVKSPKQTFIVATEEGILHQMRKAAPDKVVIPAPPEDESCACNQCPHMRRNTLEKVWRALDTLTPRIELAEPLRLRALAPLERMLALTA